MLCPLCHTENRDNAKFCKGCGRILAGEVAAQPVSAEQYANAGSTQPTQPTQLTQDHEPYPPSTQAADDPVRQQDPTLSQQAATWSTAPTEPAVEARTNQSEDISAAPTQILTPQQMFTLHQRRWQEELEREQRQAASRDVSDIPTRLQRMTQSPAAGSGRDIADYPTIITPPMIEMAPGTQQSQSPALPSDATHDANVSLPTPAAESQPAAEVLSPGEKSPVAAEERPATAAEAPGMESSTLPGISQSKETTSKQTHEQEMANTATASTKNEESSVEQTTGQEMAPGHTNTPETANTVQAAGGDSSQEHAGAFPLLAVGALVGARYEVSQVISDSADEHIYAVTDHQGYQHCWNCGSEENAEGDEFCNDCGAELLNAPYLMHEYPLVENPGGDARVLQGVIANTLVDQGHTYVIEQPQVAQMAFPNGVHLLASSDSDAGTVRRSEVNEDSTLALLFERVHESVAVPTGLFVVADGMGGHANGQGASRATIGLISERIVRELIMPPLSAEKAGEGSKIPDEESLLSLLHGSIEDANTTLCQINQRDKTDMGSTLTGFMIVGDHAYIFNVGDSRTYMLRDEKLYQLTNDHSLVGQLVAGGLIEPDDVYTHPQRNQIFRSIGDKLNVQIDLFKQQVHPGDILISCSDGLWEMVRDPQITDILNHAPDPQTACTQLIEAANANGGEDNVSAVVVFVR